MSGIMTVVELRVAKWGWGGGGCPHTENKHNALPYSNGVGGGLGGAVLILKTSITPCLILNPA